MNEYSVAIIGGGNMGGAIAHALSKDSSFKVSVYERTREKGEALKKECNISLLSSIPDATGSDVVIIALKPQNLPHLYDTLRSLKPGLYISICAGVDLGTLTKNLESEKVVRFMPNIGAKVGASVTAVAFGKEVEEDKRDLSMKIASSFGEAFPLEENLFSAFIGSNDNAICLYVLNVAGTFCLDQYARVISGFSFHAGTDNGGFGDEQRHCLALHVTTHQGTVSIVVLQEGNHG